MAIPVLRGKALNIQTLNVNLGRETPVILMRTWIAGDVKHAIGFYFLRLNMSIIGSLMHTGFSPGTDNVTCTMWNKVYKSVSGLKRHTVVHKHQILQADPIDLVGRVSFLCYICFRLRRSALGEMSGEMMMARLRGL